MEAPVRVWGRVLVLLALALLVFFLPLPVPASQPTDRTVLIRASQWQFSPGEIRVNPGDRVTVELVSADVMHGFSLDGYNFTLTAEPGQPAKGTFIANKGGVFRFRCAIPCGNMHPFMIGKLQIGPDLLLYRAVGLGFLAVFAAAWPLKAALKTAARATQAGWGKAL